MQYWHVLLYQRVLQTYRKDCCLCGWSLYLSSQTNCLGYVYMRTSLPWFSSQAVKQLGERSPKESKDCPENCWRCSQFCGETGSNSSSALQSYFFPLISRLPGQTYLFHEHCKTGQNSSASCDQIASQTPRTKLSLGSRHLNSVSPMPFLSLNRGNFRIFQNNSPPHLFLFPPALSSTTCSF